MTSEPDYVTVMATTDPRKFLVAVMTYHARDEEYIIKQVSRQPRSQIMAEGLAKMWAAGGGRKEKGT